jgi:ribosomal protein RSM22 (predicted rRNA methylase)
LNELDEEARVAMVKWMAKLARSSAPALVLIVDSSDEEVCRGLMDFRDEVVENGLKAIYPCPHDYSCPLAGSKDWCYSESRWNLPAIQQKIDVIIQHPRRTMTMSSYAFANRSFLEKQRLAAKPHQVLVGKPVDKYRKTMQIPVYCQDDGEVKKELDKAVPRISEMRGSIKQ